MDTLSYEAEPSPTVSTNESTTTESLTSDAAQVNDFVNIFIGSSYRKNEYPLDAAASGYDFSSVLDQSIDL